MPLCEQLKFKTSLLFESQMENKDNDMGQVRC